MNRIKQLSWKALHQLIKIRFPHVRSLTTHALADWLNQSDRPKPILLDTRTAEEFAVSHLANSQRLDPDTPDLMPLQTVDPDMPIVTYCSVGVRSAAIAHRLQAEGFTNVVNLEGSIFQWANEGNPVYRDGDRVYQVHPYNERWGKLLQENLHAYEP